MTLPHFSSFNYYIISILTIQKCLLFIVPGQTCVCILPKTIGLQFILASGSASDDSPIQQITLQFLYCFSTNKCNSHNLRIIVISPVQTYLNPNECNLFCLKINMLLKSLDHQITCAYKTSASIYCTDKDLMPLTLIYVQNSGSFPCWWY